MALDGVREKVLRMVLRKNEGYEMYGIQNSVLMNTSLGLNAKEHQYFGTNNFVVWTRTQYEVVMVFYETKTIGMRSAEKRRVNELQMKRLRSLVGVTNGQN